jgi:phospholipid transport system substrate-binding protein
MQTERAEPLTITSQRLSNDALFERKKQMNNTRFSKRRKINLLFRLIASAVSIWVALVPLHGWAEQSGPTEVIRTFNETLLEAMKKADDLGYSGRYKLLEPIIQDSFAISFMAAQSTGRYWKTFKEEERSLFLKTYTDWTIATYAGRFNGYSGERFDLVSESTPLQGTVTVISKLIKQNKEEIGFHYLFRKVDSAWGIVDIQISGVSQLALTRAQFVGVIKDKGFDGLISMLKDKIRGFEKGNEK